MKIAEEYFQRLLGSGDALDAVTTLDQLWCAREGVSLDKHQLGLSRPEYVVHLALMYDGEVGNGGHLQYFDNRGERSADTLEALRELQLDGRASTLERALRIFPNGVVPADPSGKQLRDLGELDRELYELSEDVDETCLRYIRAHEDEILIPERTP